MPPSMLPAADGMSSFWRSQPGSLENHRTTELLPIECDVLIIGAGYSGAALLTHLLSLDESRDKTFLALEARQLCSGATGRNGGHLKPDAYNLSSSISERYGVEAAAEVANFEIANLAAVQNYISEADVDCDFVLTRAVDVQLDHQHNVSLKARYDKFIAAGGSVARSAFYMDGEQAEMVSGVKGAMGAFSYTAGHLWPYKLIHHMFARALEKDNVNLQTNTPVTTVSQEQDADGFWTVTTPRGTVRAHQIVVATNAYTASILPEYKEKIIPYRTVCSRIVVPGPEKPPLLTNSYALRFSDWDFDYLIPRPDGSIIVGGARRTYLRHLEEWYNNADDTKVTERARGYFDGYMQKYFRGWENSGAYTDQVWAGIMGYSSDRLPRLGHVPGKKNMFLMAGFTGHGMPQIFLGAKGLSRIILQGVKFSDSGLPRLLEETKTRLESKENFAMDLHKNLPPLSRL